ncbi:MAG: HAMP domain-containing sensor histidine kinase [Ilumatobacteraceae bacterium]
MRWRLVAVFVAITVVVLAAHDIPLAAHLRTVERDRLVTGLERDAFVIAGRAEETLETDGGRGDAALQQLINAYRASSGARVVITDRGGIALAISDEEVAAGANYGTRPEIASALGGSPATGERASSTLGFRLVYVAVPVLSGQAVVGAVRLTYPASEVGQRVGERVRGLLLVALISIVTAAGAAAVLAGTLTRPIRRLRAATDRLAGGDMAVTAPIDEGPPEIRGLGQAFNAMSTRISRLLDEQRAFAGDASHQLRTPLTALRLRLDQAAEMVDEDPSGARQRIEAASSETERLQHLVAGLLALARAEGRLETQVVVDIGAVVRDRVAVWEPLAEEQRIELYVAVPEHATAWAVGGAVEQIIDNYIDNALAATPAGGRIDVVVDDAGPSPAHADRTAGTWTVALHVRDTGPGMTEEQLTRSFDRFWRGAGSPGAGSGLGLAIVNQLATACGAVAGITNRPAGGIDAAVVFRGVDAGRGSRTTVTPRTTVEARPSRGSAS